jgi:hypothetical protein
MPLEELTRPPLINMKQHPNQMDFTGFTIIWAIQMDMALLTKNHSTIRLIMGK